MKLGSSNISLSHSTFYKTFNIFSVHVFIVYVTFYCKSNFPNFFFNFTMVNYVHHLMFSYYNSIFPQNFSEGESIKCIRLLYNNESFNSIT